MLLQAVDVSRYLVVHRSGGLKQNVDSQQHPSQATNPHFHSPKLLLQGSFIQLFSNLSKMQQVKRHLFFQPSLRANQLHRIGS